MPTPSGLRIIGLTGHPGAGKDALGAMLVDELKAKGVKSGMIGGGDLLRQYVTEHNLGDPSNRTVLQSVSAQLAQEKGPDFLNILAIDYAISNGLAGLIVPGVRRVGEAAHLSQNRGVLIAIDIPAELRYERVKLRRRPGDDELDFATFLHQEAAEKNSSGHQVDAVIEMANAYVVNDGDMDSLRRVAAKILADLESGKVHHQLKRPKCYTASKH